jgi:hypothetical protein
MSAQEKTPAPQLPVACTVGVRSVGLCEMMHNSMYTTTLCESESPTHAVSRSCTKHVLFGTALTTQVSALNTSTEIRTVCSRGCKGRGRSDDPACADLAHHTRTVHCRP